MQYTRNVGHLMNMVAQTRTLPKTTTLTGSFRRTGVSSQAAAPDEVVSLPAITFDRLLTTRQVAAVLNVSVETLKKWRQRRKNLLFLRLPSGAVRDRLNTVQIFLEACAVQD